MAQKRIVVLTGLAGAGKTTAARALEDEGFFVVDNLPPPLIETLVQLADTSGEELRRIALVIDARRAQSLVDFGPTWDRLKLGGHDLTLMFLDCDDETLIRRYKETRRLHPLDEGEGIAVAIQRERQLLDDMRQRADDVIDTRDESPHDLKRLINERFGASATSERVVTVLSFGFKYGLPPELDLCFDARFLPNPHFVEELRPFCGLDAAVRDYVLGQADAQEFVRLVVGFADFVLPRFRHEGKAYVTFAVGCTGGKHRSVALAEKIGAVLRASGRKVRVAHRDLARGG